MDAGTVRATAPLVGSLRARLETTVARHVPRGSRAALVGFPYHGNIGDSVIWAGERRLLEHLEVTVAYACDVPGYDARALRRRVGDGPILLTGGGNLGDLYVHDQHLRERVLVDFPRNPVVQLPQSLHFRDPANLAAAQRAFDGHPDLTLLVRDRASLDLARRAFAAPSELCPDAGIAIGSLRRATPPDLPVLWLSRADREARFDHVPSGSDVVRVTWRDVGSRERWRRWAALLAGRLGRLAGAPAVGGIIGRALMHGMDAIADARVDAGARLLAHGRTVVTDRLHGHVLCLLLGTPHVVLDNTTGKLRDFVHTWSADHEDVHWAETPDEALAQARVLLSR